MTDETVENGTESIVSSNVETSPEIGELAKALAIAQGQLTGALKSAENPFFESKYADLAAVLEAAKPLHDNGLAIIQVPLEDDRGVALTTILAHSSGQWIRGKYRMRPEKNTPQAIGSCLTYLRRYAYSAFGGIAQKDDDGEGAMNRTVTPTVKVDNKTKKAVYEQTLACLDDADEHGLREVWHGFSQDEKVILWGMFNSQQRSTIKKMMG